MFWIDFLIFLFACLAAGLTGSLFPPGKWYSDLNKPRWTPPNWIFPVAWPILYILMSYSGATLANLENSGSALALWALQIAINTLWTPVFFGLKNSKKMSPKDLNNINLTACPKNIEISIHQFLMY